VSEFTDDIVSLIQDVYKRFIAFPDDLSVEVYAAERITIVTIKAHPDDVGVVIGRKGQNVNAVKSFLDSYSIAREDRKNFHVEVISKDSSD
jgi:predicted RNA-binding protein YlqC (UPF0109 family)